MKKVDSPKKLPIPFAANAPAPYISDIPVESQAGTNPGRASLNDGFVARNMQPIPAGGIPPYGQDANGILFLSTSWDRWLSVGGPVYYDADFAVRSGGYPAEAIIRSRIVPGKLWMSTTDDNVNDPDAFGAGWVEPPFGHRTGDILGNIFPDDTPPGWLVARAGLTIGAPGSSATVASAMTVFLYVKTWLKFSNAQCPVTGGRGANALADYNALKPIQVYDMSGTGLIGADATTGRLTGAPVIAGNLTTPGSLIGENRHTLTIPEIPAHQHDGTSGTESTTHVHFGSGTTASMNRSNPHNHAQLARTGIAEAQQGTSYRNLWNGENFGVGTDFTDINHEHAYSFQTGGQNVFHTHYLLTNPTGGSGSHNLISRNAVVDWLQRY